jgi:hypothetical protein
VYRATTATETPCVYGHNFVFPDEPYLQSRTAALRTRGYSSSVQGAAYVQPSDSVAQRLVHVVQVIRQKREKGKDSTMNNF